MSAGEHTLTAAMLAALDALYEDHEAITPFLNRHRQWDILVEELRAIRRLVEAGVAVKIEGTPTVLTTWQEFYTWAHGRYYLLEEGADHWIGDDDS